MLVNVILHLPVGLVIKTQVQKRMLSFQSQASIFNIAEPKYQYR